MEHFEAIQSRLRHLEAQQAELLRLSQQIIQQQQQPQQQQS
jgi:hypothetical protein